MYVNHIYTSEEPIIAIIRLRRYWIYMIKEQQVYQRVTSVAQYSNTPPHLLLLWTSLRTDTCSCWYFPQACSKADKILRRTPSDILQICCLGCCTAVPNAAASRALWIDSREDGNAFHFSSELLWRFIRFAVCLLLHLRGIPTFEQVPDFSAGLWTDAVFQQL